MVLNDPESLDFEHLSESNLGALSWALEIYENKSFSALSDESHDSAWDSAIRDDAMSILEIAKAGGANKEMEKYISLRMENKKLFA